MLDVAGVRKGAKGQAGGLRVVTKAGTNRVLAGLNQRLARGIVNRMLLSVTKRLMSLMLLGPICASCISQAGNTGVMPREIPEKMMASHLLTSPAAKLPDGLLKRCSNALVTLKITIDKSGRVIDEEAESGYSELKSPSLTAVKEWTYKPFEQDGHALPARSRVSIFFLGDGESFPMYLPDGKGGAKGGNILPLPPGCGGNPSFELKPD
ncbi:MAG TPA: energy transducer TonB [Acidobacteriaceae bacterium]|nr:energy transducer TonB [Acidobacteriaceae bacterium]